MRSTLRHLETLLPAALLLIASASTAHAQVIAFDIESLGAPGTTDWEDNCATELDLIHGPGHGLTPKLPIDKEYFPENFGTDSTPQLEHCSSTDPYACLHRVTIDTYHYPHSVCSDGSPGTFYVRPGRNGSEGKWMIHLQGGGGCTSYEECVSRWCGVQGAYSAAKMSTDWDDPAADEPDVLERAIGLGARELPSAVTNGLEDWNHVYVYYCSSDAWMGRKTNVSLTNQAGDRTVSLRARGHTILSTMRKMLRHNGPTTTSWFPAGVTLPDLDLATDIVFSGTSAGAIGAIENADWFLSSFPGANTALVLDAIVSPTQDAIDFHDLETQWPPGSGTYVDYGWARDELLRQAWQPGGYFALVNAFVDQTCRDTMNLSILDISHLCSHTSGLLHGETHSGTPFIETPTFIRAALNDEVIWGSLSPILEVPDGAGGHDPVDRPTFVHMMRDSLVDLFHNTTPVTGVFAPRCGPHVGLSLHNAFFEDTTEDVTETSPGVFVAGGVVSTFHDALASWYGTLASGGSPSLRYIDHPVAADRTSSCSLLAF
jgi:hypothetical protein